MRRLLSFHVVLQHFINGERMYTEKTPKKTAHNQDYKCM